MEKEKTKVVNRDGIIQLKKFFCIEIWKNSGDHFFFKDKSLSFGPAIYGFC